MLVASACHSTPSIIGPKAVRIHGPIHTEGSRIIDATGRVVEFNGVNVRDFIRKPGATTAEGRDCAGPRPQATVANLAAWGFNSVRIPLAWSNIEPEAPLATAGGITHHWNEEFLSSLDSFINDLTNHGLAVVLDMHAGYRLHPDRPCESASLPLWADPPPSADETAAATARCAFLQGAIPTGPTGNTWDQFTAMSTMLAQRYASNPQVVAMDMLNEPYPRRGTACAVSGVRIGDLYEQIAQSVRLASPSLSLIAEDSPPGLALQGQWGVNPPLDLSNVIYSYHMYQPNWVPKGEAVHNAYRARAQQWGAPLLVGEFNAFGFQAPGSAFDPNWESDTEAAMTTWRQQGVSWIVSAYSGGNHLIDLKTGAPRADLISAYQKGFDSPSSSPSS
jgi:hypothetical protein